MRISRREHAMALELERRALELLGENAPAWALADAGQLGPDVQVVDDDGVEDVTEPEVTDDAEPPTVQRQEPTPDGEWRSTAGRMYGRDLLAAAAAAEAAFSRATPDDSLEVIADDARTPARRYPDERQERSTNLERVQSTLIDLGLSEHEAAQATLAALLGTRTATPSGKYAGFSQLLTRALREASRLGSVSAEPLKTGWRDFHFEPLSVSLPRVVIHGKDAEISPDVDPQIAAALIAFAAASADAEEPDDQDDRPAPLDPS